MLNNHLDLKANINKSKTTLFAGFKGLVTIVSYIKPKQHVHAGDTDIFWNNTNHLHCFKIA